MAGGLGVRDAEGLTPAQARFVAAYTGNAQETARIVGLSGDYGQEMAEKPQVRAAILRRNEEANKDLVMGRLELMAFWSRVVRGDEQEVDGVLRPTAEMKDRLKASELLGKARMDFVDKHIVETTVDATVAGTIRGLDERVKQVLAATVGDMGWL